VNFSHQASRLLPKGKPPRRPSTATRPSPTRPCGEPGYGAASAAARSSGSSRCPSCSAESPGCPTCCPRTVSASRTSGFRSSRAPPGCSVCCPAPTSARSAATATRPSPAPPCPAHRRCGRARPIAPAGLDPEDAIAGVVHTAATLTRVFVQENTRESDLTLHSRHSTARREQKARKRLGGACLRWRRHPGVLERAPHLNRRAREEDRTNGLWSFASGDFRCGATHGRAVRWARKVVSE